MALSVLLARGAQRSVTAQLRSRSGPPRLSLRPSATHQRWSQSIRRRELLATGGSLWLFNQFQQQHSSAQHATAVFQEISVQVAPSSDGNPEPVENPPTYVKATGKIVASECTCTHLSSGGALRCAASRVLTVAARAVFEPC